MTKGLESKKKDRELEGKKKDREKEETKLKGGVGKPARLSPEERRAERMVKSATRRVDKSFRTRGGKKVEESFQAIEDGDPGAIDRLLQQSRREKPPGKVGSDNIYSGKSRTFSQTCIDDFWADQPKPWTCASKSCKEATTTIDPKGRGSAARSIDHKTPWATVKTMIPTMDVCCNGIHWRVVTSADMRAAFEDDDNLVPMHQGCNSTKNGPKDTDGIGPQRLGLCPGDRLCTLDKARN